MVVVVVGPQIELEELKELLPELLERLEEDDSLELEELSLDKESIELLELEILELELLETLPILSLELLEELLSGN